MDDLMNFLENNVSSPNPRPFPAQSPEHIRETEDQSGGDSLVDFLDLPPTTLEDLLNSPEFHPHSPLHGDAHQDTPQSRPKGRHLEDHTNRPSYSAGTSSEHKLSSASPKSESPPLAVQSGLSETHPFCDSEREEKKCQRQKGDLSPRSPSPSHCRDYFHSEKSQSPKKYKSRSPSQKKSPEKHNETTGPQNSQPDLKGAKDGVCPSLSFIIRKIRSELGLTEGEGLPRIYDDNLRTEITLYNYNNLPPHVQSIVLQQINEGRQVVELPPDISQYQHNRLPDQTQDKSQCMESLGLRNNARKGKVTSLLEEAAEAAGLLQTCEGETTMGFHGSSSATVPSIDPRHENSGGLYPKEKQHNPFIEATMYHESHANVPTTGPLEYSGGMYTKNEQQYMGNLQKKARTAHERELDKTCTEEHLSPKGKDALTNPNLDTSPNRRLVTNSPLTSEIDHHQERGCSSEDNDKSFRNPDSHLSSNPSYNSEVHPPERIQTSCPLSSSSSSSSPPDFQGHDDISLTRSPPEDSDDDGFDSLSYLNNLLGNQSPKHYESNSIDPESNNMDSEYDNIDSESNSMNKHQDSSSSATYTLHSHDIVTNNLDSVEHEHTTNQSPIVYENDKSEPCASELGKSEPSPGQGHFMFSGYEGYMDHSSLLPGDMPDDLGQLMTYPDHGHEANKYECLDYLNELLAEEGSHEATGQCITSPGCDPDPRSVDSGNSNNSDIFQSTQDLGTEKGSGSPFHQLTSASVEGDADMFPGSVEHEESEEVGSVSDKCFSVSGTDHPFHDIRANTSADTHEDGDMDGTCRDMELEQSDMDDFDLLNNHLKSLI